jgi:hypothetical protein
MSASPTSSCSSDDTNVDSTTKDRYTIINNRILIIDSSVEVLTTTFFVCMGREVREKITTVYIPPKCVHIHAGTFKDWIHLTHVFFTGYYSSLETIGESAFEGCGVFYLSIPSSVWRIENNAFARCVNLRGVDFGEDSRLVHLHTGAFASTALKHIRLPPGLLFIDRGAFFKCPATMTIVFDISYHNEYPRIGGVTSIDKEHAIQNFRRIAMLRHYCTKRIQTRLRGTKGYRFTDDYCTQLELEWLPCLPRFELDINMFMRHGIDTTRLVSIKLPTTGFLDATGNCFGDKTYFPRLRMVLMPSSATREMRTWYEREIPVSLQRSQPMTVSLQRSQPMTVSLQRSQPMQTRARKHTATRAGKTASKKKHAV